MDDLTDGCGQSKQAGQCNRTRFQFEHVHTNCHWKASRAAEPIDRQLDMVVCGLQFEVEDEGCPKARNRPSDVAPRLAYRPESKGGFRKSARPVRVVGIMDVVFKDMSDDLDRYSMKDRASFAALLNRILHMYVGCTRYNHIDRFFDRVICIHSP